ncbi:hypothetical protein AUP68_11582 [Ilyonectria robusta]
MSVELALAIPPTIDLCLKYGLPSLAIGTMKQLTLHRYGRELKALCTALKHADADISERILRLDNGWLRWSHQLNFLQRVQHMMDEEHCEIYHQTLHVFLGKLEMVTAMLKRLVRRGPDDPTGSSDGGGCYSTRRMKYAMMKNSLDRAIEELEIWQSTADHSWFLLMKIASPQVDFAIASDHASIAATIPSALAIRAGLRDGGTPNGPGASGITFRAEELARMAVWPIPFCDAQLARWPDNPAAAYILNYIRCPLLSKYQVVKKDTRDLVRKLQHDEPQTFGLLSCKGFVVDQQPGSGPEPYVNFAMIFRTPRGASNPRSLRDLLLNAPTPKSLSSRFEIARELAKSVNYVHSFGFVHKNIRPESVLVFDTGDRGTTARQSAYLVGFENFRREDGWTRRRGDDTLERNLYRHPSRQGSSPREDYVMQHDIYSLGVCLLEVGLWESFVEHRGPDCLPTPSPSLGLPAHVDVSQPSSFVETAGREHLLHLVKTRLPTRMGTRYSEIVETCLTCLDPENADFGDEHEFEDEDGIRVGVRYIEKVSCSP